MTRTLYTMQTNLIIATIVLIACTARITNGAAINKVDANIVIAPDLTIPKLCTFMGGECTNTTICCNNNECDNPYGYQYLPTRCCGTDGASGCKVVPGTNGIGCCRKHYCDYLNGSSGKTTCRQIIY